MARRRDGRAKREEGSRLERKASSDHGNTQGQRTQKLQGDIAEGDAWLVTLTNEGRRTIGRRKTMYAKVRIDPGIVEGPKDLTVRANWERGQRENNSSKIKKPRRDEDQTSRRRYKAGGGKRKERRKIRGDDSTKTRGLENLGTITMKRDRWLACRGRKISQKKGKR